MSAAGIRAGRVATLAWLALMLAACASPPVRQAGDEPALASLAAHELSIRASTRWSLAGRIAVSDGRDGGSGRIVWHQDGGRYTIEIKAPVSRRTWRLSGGPGRALLEGLDGGPRRDTDAESLLRREVGWSVPFEHLRDWARGARGEGGARVDFDHQRRLERLEQRGWTVEYRGWTEGTPRLPTRVFASQGERRVRLAVERWNLDPARG